MDLGAFSVSLSVSDLPRSRAFYEKLGFRAVGGVEAQNWLILRNGACTLGLFQGMFEGNMLTFNPGWDAEGSAKADFEDIRTLQSRLRDAGIDPVQPVSDDRGASGPGSLMLRDPDGNAILLDQHV